MKGLSRIIRRKRREFSMHQNGKTGNDFVYELDRSNVAIDGNETSMRLGDFITGAWVSWEGVMVRPRVQETTDCPLLDVIDSGGTHTIAVGENAISMETGVTFPMKGCLYEYRADGWFRKARFEHIYEGAADGLALIQKIQYGIEEFGLEDFVLRFSPDKNGGCEGLKKCIAGENYCNVCQENGYLCKTCEEGYLPDENGGCTYSYNCEISPVQITSQSIYNTLSTSFFIK